MKNSSSTFLIRVFAGFFIASVFLALGTPQVSHAQQQITSCPNGVDTAATDAKNASVPPDLSGSLTSGLNGTYQVCKPDAQGNVITLQYQTTNGVGGYQLVGTNQTGQTVSTVNGNTGGDVAKAAVKGATNIFMTALMWILKQIALLFLFLSNVFLALGGAALNWIMYVTIFQFGNIIGNNAGLLAAWRVLRDIGNIVLLFGFIFMGVSTILNLPGNEFTAKKALPTLIIFALLMNFSLFAAEAVIDVSNAFGTAIYSSATSAGCPTTDISCVTNSGIFTSIMTISGLSGIWNGDQAAFQQSTNMSDLTYLILVLGLTLFCLIAAFVFLAAVVMFSIRLIVLAFVMVTSPIGFAGMAIPPLNGLARSWWQALLKQSFFAPIFLLMLLVSIKFMEGVTAALPGGAHHSLVDAFSSSGISNIGIIVNFILIIGFMIAAVMLAQSLGAAGASGAQRLAGGVVFGGYTRLTNAAVGYTARGTRSVVQRSPLGNTAVGRAIGNGLRPLESVNLDVRRAVPIPALGRASEHASLKDMEHQAHEVRTAVDKSNAQYDKERSLQKLKGEMEDIKSGKATALSAASERFVANLSADEMTDMHLMHSMDVLAERLTPDQFEAIMKSDKISETDKGHARDARYQTLATQINLSDGTNIRKWSNKDLEQFFLSPTYANMNVNEKAEFVSLLSDDQYDNLNKGSKLTGSQKTDIQTFRNESRFDTAPAYELDTTDPAHPVRKVMKGSTGADMTRLERTLKNMNSNSRAKLDDRILAKQEVYTKLNPADFDAIRRAEKLTDEQRAEVGKHIDAVLADSKHELHDKFKAYQGTVSQNTWRSLQAYYGIKTDKTQPKVDVTEKRENGTATAETSSTTATPSSQSTPNETSARAKELLRQQMERGPRRPNGNP